jgi:hypothetical protein
MKTYYDSDFDEEIDRLAESKLDEMLSEPVDSVDLYESGIDEIILEINGNGVIITEKQLDEIINKGLFLLQERDRMNYEEMDKRRQWDA